MTMEQSWGKVPDEKHVHLDGPDARFAANTLLCTECVGRAFLMATTPSFMPVMAERINAILDRLRDERAKT